MSFVKYSVSAFGSLAVAMMSRSRTVSLRRRALPASQTRSAAGCSRSTSTTASSAGSAWPSSARGGPVAFFLRAVDLRMLSSVFAPRPGSVRRRWARAASFSSASVVTPSSCQILRTVFGPRPGMLQELDHLGRDRLAPLRERLDLAGVHDLDDLVLDRGADPRQLLRRPVERQLGDRRARLAHARGRAAVGEHAESGLALDLQQVGQQLELLGHVRVAGERLRHDSDHRGVKAVVCLPTYNERENLERMVERARRQGRLRCS